MKKSQLRKYLENNLTYLEKNIEKQQKERPENEKGFLSNEYSHHASMYLLALSADDLEKSSRRVEMATWVLIGWTIVLVALTTILMMKTVG